MNTPRHCQRCGIRLAHDNFTSHCAPCRSAAVPSAPPEVPPRFWTTPAMQEALATRHMGRVIRAYRHHPYHGGTPLSQDTLAEWAYTSQARMSRTENGQLPDRISELVNWARLLRISARYLWFPLPDADQAPEAAHGNRPGLDRQRECTCSHPLWDGPTLAGTETWKSDGGSCPVHSRRSFLAAGASVIATGTVPPPRVGEEEVSNLSADISRLWDLDQRHGSADLAGVAQRLLSKVHRTIEQSSYASDIGSTLHAIASRLGSDTGWALFEAGRHPEARNAWRNAIGDADLAGSDLDAAGALQLLSLQAVYRGHYPLALRAAQHARDRVGRRATPRVQSLLAIREAQAHAALRDIGAARKCESDAIRFYDRGPRPNDPDWISFLQDLDISGQASKCYLSTPRNAAKRLYDALDHTAVSPAWWRNHVDWTSQYARALARAGEVEEGCAVADEIMPSVADVSSVRVQSILTDAVRVLSRHHTSATRDLEEKARVYALA